MIMKSQVDTYSILYFTSFFTRHQQNAPLLKGQGGYFLSRCILVPF